MPFPDGCVHGVVSDHPVSEVSHPHGLRPILWPHLQTGGSVRVAFLELRPQPASERRSLAAPDQDGEKHCRSQSQNIPDATETQLKTI